MSDRPTTGDEAYELMMDWAEGKRSWMNLGPHEPHAPDVIARMDAAEVDKWGRVYLTFLEAESIAVVKSELRRSM